MGLSTFSEICNFKGRKVIEKSAFGGSNAPSAITFEPFDRKFSYLGNQCILPNPILWWKDKKFDPKIWSKFGQTWPNLGQKFFHSKVSNKWTHMHEKSWFSKNLLIGLTLAKSAKSKFCQTVTNQGKNSGMIFHVYGTIYLTLLNEKKFDPNLAKFDQIWTKFWGAIFCPSTTKWDLARCIDSPSMKFFCQTVQKLSHLVRWNHQRPISL